MLSPRYLPLTHTHTPFKQSKWILLTLQTEEEKTEMCVNPDHSVILKIFVGPTSRLYLGLGGAVCSLFISPKKPKLDFSN